MGIAKVKVNISQGNISRIGSTQDGLMGMILVGNEVAGKIRKGVPYQLFSLADAINLGITAESKDQNAYVYKQIKEFYDEVDSGALWLMLVDTKTTLADMVDVSKAHAPALLLAAKGAINVLGIGGITNARPTSIAGGLDADVYAAVGNAQKLCEKAAKDNNPLRCVVSGRHYQGVAAGLRDNKKDSSDRVAILIGASDMSREACIGLCLGRLARIYVQENLGKVKTGKLNIPQGYFTDGNTSESKANEFDAIDDNKFIFLRTFGNHKEGYYFNNDYTCTSETAAYNSLSAGRTIDKAHRIAYATFLEHLLDNIKVEKDGSLPQLIASSFEAQIEAQIRGQMVDNGELSHVEALIKTSQKVLENSTLSISLFLVPVGTLKNILVDLSFSTIQQ